MSLQPRVQIVIPNWNGRHLLPRCLAALADLDYESLTVVVIDNGSTDGSVGWLKARAAHVRVLTNSENQGFAYAVNQGIRQGDARYVVTLNNDTEVGTEWLESLVEVAETDRAVGMVASKMLFADRPRVINSAGICVDRAGIAWDRLGGTRDDPQASETEEVFGPCAGAALYRRAMLDEVGLFDEDFFAYLEDVDLAWRARRAGWRCLYAPKARVLHHHSATGKEGSPFKSFHLGRNKMWLLAKNYPFHRLWRYVPLVLLYDMLAVIYALAARGDVHALRGRLVGLSSWREMWRKREDLPIFRSRADIEFLEPIASPRTVQARYRHIRTTGNRSAKPR